MRGVVASLLVALAGCSTPTIGKPPDWPESPEGAASCIRLDVVVAYLTSLKEQVIDAWVLPQGVPADREVTIGFILEPSGRLARAAVFEASSRRLAFSALRAVKSVAFPPPPVGAECVAGITIVGFFDNPASF